MHLKCKTSRVTASAKYYREMEKSQNVRKFYSRTLDREIVMMDQPDWDQTKKYIRGHKIFQL